jgi:hypothetical protein
MHRLWNPISLALITLTLSWAAGPGFAQQPATDLVPFKASWMGVTPPGSGPFNTATYPAIVSFPGIQTGQSDLFGAFTGVSLATQRLGVDAKPLYSTVVAEWTMANGDALSVEIPAFVYVPQTAPDAPLLEGAFLNTNGKGRFLGARGSGFVKGVPQLDPVTRERTGTIVSVEGLITRPK